MKKLILTTLFIVGSSFVAIFGFKPLTVNALVENPSRYDGKEISVRGYTDIIKMLEGVDLNERLTLGYVLYVNDDRLIILTENGRSVAAGGYAESTGVFHQDYELYGVKKPVLIQKSYKSIWR